MVDCKYIIVGTSLILVLCPDPTLSQGKGSGDFSLGCVVNSELANAMSCKLAYEDRATSKVGDHVQNLVPLSWHNQENGQ